MWRGARWPRARRRHTSRRSSAFTPTASSTTRPSRTRWRESPAGRPGRSSGGRRLTPPRSAEPAGIRDPACLAALQVLGVLAALIHRAPAPVAALGGVEKEPAAALAGAFLEPRRRVGVEQVDRAGHRDV